MLAYAIGVAWQPGIAAAQSPGTSSPAPGASASSADSSADSSGEPEAKRRNLFKRTKGMKWQTDLDPKEEPWSGLTDEQAGPAKDERQSGFLDRLRRGWSKGASNATGSSDRALEGTDAAGAPRAGDLSAKQGANKQTNLANVVSGNGLMPQIATAASFNAGDDLANASPASGGTGGAREVAQPPGSSFASTDPGSSVSSPAGIADGNSGGERSNRGSDPNRSPRSQPSKDPGLARAQRSYGSAGSSYFAPPPVGAPSDESDLPFHKRFFQGYPALVEWFPRHIPKPAEEPDEPALPRRAPPSPWYSPPFPVSEFQGYPLIGVPPGTIVDPLMNAVYRGPWGEPVKNSRVEMHGWITTAGVWGNAKHSNTPDAYWIVPNSYQLDQFIVKFEREIDTVQTDHWDWGFRSVSLYGIDYRYTTAGGWFSDQLLKHNSLYGWDPVEQYLEVYVPRIFEGFVFRLGRWIACPDIETQYAPDNYMGSHSLLFTFDTYTQTGAMFSFQITNRLMLQAAIESGTDMAPWYPGATPTLFAGCRWVSESNNDAFYTCLNNWNNSHFRYFMQDGHLAGHDNFNYIVSTYEHRFSQKIHTKTEAYYMWQVNAVVGGTPSFGPTHDFGGGGGFGKFLPGTSKTYGVLNYTPIQLSDKDYFVIRNEWWRDERGERSGFPTNYSSHALALSHQFNDVLMIRPEIGFYHSYDVPAFDLGKKNSILIYGFDLTLRF